MGSRGFGGNQEPSEIAQAYVDERLPDSGWRVEEVTGDVNFAMVTVVLGRYLKSGDIEKREAGAEGRGTSIEAAVDDALETTVD